MIPNLRGRLVLCSVSLFHHIKMTNNERTEEVVLSLLKSAITPGLPVTGCSRDAYQKRLRSFRPLTYFAKPESLSPIVCARFGYVFVVWVPNRVN